MSYSVAMSPAVADCLHRHLIRKDGQEDLCFALWKPSNGIRRTTAIIWSVLLPNPGERHVHGNVSFEGRFFERAVVEAERLGCGLAFLHSHPATGWQLMSDDDVAAEEKHAPTTFGITGLPLVGLTVGSDKTWSARFWTPMRGRAYKRNWCSTVRVLEQGLQISYADHLLPPPNSREELKRTVSAWSPMQHAKLTRIHVGIVGAGSVGCIIAETLARMGFQHISLIDFDTVKRHNLDRLLHATRRDVTLAESKVKVLARGVRRSHTASIFDVEEHEYSIAEEEGYRAALDCDVLFSCVDRPWARSILNYIAYAHLIPVVDGGIRVESDPISGLRRADWRAHIAMPGRKCLECLEQYDPGLVAVEMQGFLDDPEYISGLPSNHALKRNENVMAFSMSVASFEVLQFLMMILEPMGQANPGAQMYRFFPGILDRPNFDACRATCSFKKLIGLADFSGMKLTGRHSAAEHERQDRIYAKKKAPLFTKVLNRFENMLYYCH